MDTTSFKRVLIFFTCLGMPVNITQYWGGAGIFNNLNFVFRAKFSNFIGHKCWSTNHLYFKLHYPIYPMNLVLFLVFVIVLSFLHVQNHWVAPRSTQPFILPRSIKWVPGISGNLVVKSKLPPRSDSSLEAVEPHP